MNVRYSSVGARDHLPIRRRGGSSDTFATTAIGLTVAFAAFQAYYY